MNWGRTFYQSGSSLSSATAIALGPGEERAGIDITLTPSRPAKLTMTLTDSNGAPVEGLVDLMMVDDALGAVTRNIASPFPPPNPAVTLPPRVVALEPGNWIGVGFAGDSREVTVSSVSP